MITKENLAEVLEHLGFIKNNDIYSKNYKDNKTIKVDFKNEKIIYPNAIIKGDETTSNFSHPENFVVLECVNRLLTKGYEASHLELEPRYKLGKESKTSGKADILVKNKNNKAYIIIECKTAGSEFQKEWKNMLSDGGQLFSYFQQEKSAEFLCLYTSDFSEKIIVEQKIINVKDNELFLQEKNKKGYKEAKNISDLYNVWKDVYEFDCSNTGIFEDNINAYGAGKFALSFNDLKEFQKQDQDGKYHEFAKILRKHNISGKENAFDKLINLFLCKIYDEKYNKNNLDFCYRGVMSDSFEKLQDRLMLLYKDAMQKFLGENITYVSQEQIDDQFIDFKANKIKTKALQEQMHEFLRQLKFYSHSDFSFLEVHNKDLFTKNGEVLKEVVRLFENYKLTENSTTQILSDLFELFLQKGMKQDEGQFFTPLQICEFIMHALPLENMLENNSQLKVLDYACGAGHFLNTYANIAKQIAPNHKSQIYGIEKEYRLSKVAKVSSAMYAHDIKFTYADALDKEKFSEKDFNLLVANPPYSVKGFLETLDDKICKSYELFNEKLNKETNAIECFFIERANDLLESGAKAAIILPSSILSKDGIYAKTREIILRNFEIVSICELPSGTFGATGTNTIILFLNKKPTYGNSKNSQEYKNLSENIKDSLSFENVFLIERLKKYCTFMGFLEDDYKDFLTNKLNDNLANNELFKDYKNIFENSKELKNLQNSKNYKNADSTAKETLENDEFYKFCLAKEKERFLYFCFVYTQNTLIIKAPSDNKSIKKFLGYEWSNAKGNEGLHELNNPYFSPLYEQGNRDNPHKLAFLIKSNFLGESIQINSDCENFAAFVSLSALIDFKGAEFSNALNLGLATTNNINIASPFENSKFELVRLGDYIQEQPKSKIQVNQAKENTNGAYPFFTSGENVYKYDEFLIDNKNIFLSTGGNARVKFYNGKCAYSTDTYVICAKNDEILTYYIFILLENKTSFINDFYFKGMGLKHLQKNDFKNIKIPLPPLKIQKEIVEKCEEIEKQYQSIRMSIDEYQKLIKAVLVKSGIINESGGGYELNLAFIADKTLLALIDDLPSTPPNGWEMVRLSNTNKFDIKIGKRVLDKELNSNAKIPVYSANVCEPFGFIDKELLRDYSSPSVLWGIDGDWMTNFIAEDLPFYPTDHCGILRSIDENIKTRILEFSLNEAGKKANFSRSLRASIDRIKALSLPIPPLKEQEKIIKTIENIEQKINDLKANLNSLKDKQKETLEKYLF